MSVVRNLTVKIGADLSGMQKGLNQASKDLKKAGKEMSAVGSSLTKGLTLPILGMAAAASKAAIDYESAFAGVRKTVEATESQFSSLNSGILEMTKSMPQSAVEIAGISEAAGQLGIQTDNILGFTKTMAMLGDTTNMASAEAATSLARFANITQMSQQDFDKLGSTIVALGNNLATTESEIVEMSLRLAGAGKQVGMTEAQIMSLAGALSSVGIEAAAGGSAFSKVMVNMQLAVETGGRALDDFARVAGMSASEFKTAFQKDAAGALVTFIQGLQDTDKLGGSAIKILDEMGITEVRMRDALLRAAGAGDLFNQSIEIGTQAWEENIALQKEAEQRYATIESQLAMLGNNLKIVGITLGQILMPHITAIVEKIREWVDSFSSLDKGTQNLIIKAALIVAAIGPTLSVVGKLTTSFGGMAKVLSGSLKDFTVAGGGIKGITAALGALIGPAGIVILVIAAVAALIAIFVNLYKNNEEFRNKVNEVWTNIKETVSPLIEEIGELVKVVFEGIQAFLTEHGDSIMAVLEAAWNVIWAVLETVINMILALVKIFTALIKGDWEGVWNGIKEYFSAVWKGILNILTAFGDYIIAVIRGWGDVLGGLFKSIWEGIWGGIKWYINLILSGIETFINGAIWAINGLIKGINKIIGAAGGVIGIELKIPELKNVKIPRLAQGAVIPPNSEFLAMLGDQSSGINIETPLDTMIDAFETSLDNNGRTANIYVELDGRTIARVVGQPLVDMIRVKGAVRA